MKRNSESFSVKQERRVGFYFGTCVGAVGLWFIHGIYSSWDMLKDVDLASWVQAIGTIAAVGSGFYLNSLNQRKEKIKKLDSALRLFSSFDSMLESGVLLAIKQGYTDRELNVSEISKNLPPGSFDFKSIDHVYSIYYQQGSFRSDEFLFLLDRLSNLNFEYLDPLLEYEVKKVIDSLRNNEKIVKDLLEEHQLHNSQIAENPNKTKRIRVDGLKYLIFDLQALRLSESGTLSGLIKWFSQSKFTK